MPGSKEENSCTDPNQASLVSVVIPAYNASRYISATIDSVLNQTHSNREIIVINDGSPDTTVLEATLQPYLPRLRYFSQENRGPSAARNLGIREARGRYVAFLDSDDVWLPHHLFNQVQHLERDRELGLVYANNSQIDEDGYTHDAFDRVPQECPVTLDSLLTERSTVNTSSVVVLREALLQTSLFDEQMRRCEDFDLWLRLASNGVKISYDPGVNMIHRRGNGLASDRELMKQARREVYKKASATLPLTTAQKAIVTSRIRKLDKEIEIDAAKRHLRKGTYDESLAAIQRARSFGPDLRLGFVASALRCCPAFFRWCYEHYVETLHSYKRRHRTRWEPQPAGSLNPEVMTRPQVLDR
jgi:glycosyltransferase involved in cell wall biosynthesis